MSGDAYIVSSGPSAEHYDWSGLKPEDYILAVNFSGLLCPRFNAVVALDVDVPGTFSMYPTDVTFYTRNKGKALDGFTNIKRLKTMVHGAGRSGAAFGLYVLYHLGYKNVVAIGMDVHLNGRYSRAKRLIDLGLYPVEDSPKAQEKRAAVDETIKALKLNVSFFNPIFERAGT